MSELFVSREKVKAEEMARPVRRCAQIVCREYGLTIGELRGRCRRHRIVRPRQVAAWLAFKLCVSYPLIGHHLGGFDHTTIIHARRKVDKRRAMDPEFRALTDQLLAELLKSPQQAPQEALQPPPVVEAPEQPPPPATPPEPARHDPWASEPQWYDGYRGRVGCTGSERSYLELQNARFCAAMLAELQEGTR